MARIVYLAQMSVDIAFFGEFSEQMSRGIPALLI